MSHAPGVLLLVENNGYPKDFRVRREATALRDAGYTVSVVCPRDKNQRWTEVIDEVHIYRFPAPPGGNGVLGFVLEFGYATFAMLLLSLWVCVRRRVNVVHAANPPDMLCIIGAVFRLMGKKFIFDHHDLSPEIYLSRFTVERKNMVYRVLSMFERLSFAIANVVISTNETFRQRAITRGRMHPDRVFVVRNGPPQSYQPVEPDPALVARARHIVGYVGTIGPQDGLDYWIRAVGHMVHDHGRKDFLAVIIGDGDALEHVQALAKQLQVEEYVWFTGRLSEDLSRKTLSAACLCVQPDPKNSLNDHSTMNKMMEYMALGKPTVAFDLLETRYSAQDAARYAQPNDVQHFAQLVLQLLDAEDQCKAMGMFGRNRVASSLAWEHSVPHLLAAYDKTLGHRAAARPHQAQPRRADLA
jgi:glycosyltransferase involved in cell wall biosynthesis